MRFFFFDGKAIRGPLEVPELLERPGFDSETLVCPAGSQRSEDWKPAVNYDSLREALLQPTPPAPQAQVPTVRCRICGRSNPDGAAFCNHCGSQLGKAGELTLGDQETIPMAAQARAFGPGPGPQRRLPSRRVILAAAAAAVLVGGSATAYLLHRKRAPVEEASPASAFPPAPPAPGPKAQAAPKPAPVQTPRSLRRPKGAPRQANAPPEGGRDARPPASTAPRQAPVQAGHAPPGAEAAPAGPDMDLPGIPKRARRKAASRSLAADEPQAAEPPAPEAVRPSGAHPTSDELLAESAKEQFTFCHQLMRQGEFDDVFDFCLCGSSKQGAPFNGRKSVFVEQCADDPQTEAGSSFEVLSAKAAGPAVGISGRWTLAEGSAVERTERWQMENGNWCWAIPH